MNGAHTKFPAMRLSLCLRVGGRAAVGAINKSENLWRVLSNCVIYVASTDADTCIICEHNEVDNNLQTSATNYKCSISNNDSSFGNQKYLRSIICHKPQLPFKRIVSMSDCIVHINFHTYGIKRDRIVMPCPATVSVPHNDRLSGCVACVLAKRVVLNNHHLRLTLRLCHSRAAAIITLLSLCHKSAF